MKVDRKVGAGFVVGLLVGMLINPGSAQALGIIIAAILFVIFVFVMAALLADDSTQQNGGK